MEMVIRIHIILQKSFFVLFLSINMNWYRNKFRRICVMENNFLKDNIW